MVSKPVPRPVLVVGKFLGILGVLLMSVLLQSFVFMLAEYHTVLQTVRDPIHLPVLFLGGGAIVVGLAVATWMNYFYGRNFPASAMLAIAPLLGVAWALALNFGPDFSRRPFTEGFRVELWLAVGLALHSTPHSKLREAFSAHEHWGGRSIAKSKKFLESMCYKGTSSFS